ncbi:hypothetical protein LTR84_011274 [Exophiala bonariae]|uniref:Peptidase S54 rhomboid domain-containing protein n=1 Tax=Exophiala bonariae TaxID=1690606 RepID=A0AAV9MUR1_9EURO|nr:hypothetical protein LTR84_011274 [Exophiala bonariae]
MSWGVLRGRLPARLVLRYTMCQHAIPGLAQAVFSCRPSPRRSAVPVHFVGFVVGSAVVNAVLQTPFRESAVALRETVTWADALNSTAAAAAANATTIPNAAAIPNASLTING